MNFLLKPPKTNAVHLNSYIITHLTGVHDVGLSTLAGNSSNGSISFASDVGFGPDCPRGICDPFTTLGYMHILDGFLGWWLVINMFDKKVHLEAMHNSSW